MEFRNAKMFGFAGAFALCAIGMIGCGATDAEEIEDDAAGEFDEKADSSGQPQAVEISNPEDGKTYQVADGQDFALKLAGNAGNGYQWKVVATDRTFGYPTVEVKDLGQPGSVGGGLETKMTWKTRGPLNFVGNHLVKLEYVRPFDPEHPAKSLSITVSVTANATPYVLVDPANGKKVSVKAGRDFVLKLHGAAGNGYQWKVVSTDRSFGYPEVTETSEGAPGSVGGPLLTTLTWKTSGPLDLTGVHTVKLDYMRSFDPSHPAKNLKVVVKIKP